MFDQIWDWTLHFGPFYRVSNLGMGQEKGVAKFVAYNLNIKNPWTVEKLYVVINPSHLKYPMVGLVENVLDRILFTFFK